MTSPPHDDRSPRAEAQHAAADRDAGLRRVRHTTRWLAAGAIGLTGALAGVTAQQTLPAKASSASASNDAGSAAAAQAPAAGESADGYTGDGGYGDDGSAYSYDDGGSYSGAPQAPAQAPQQAPQQVAPSVSSGAS